MQVDVDCVFNCMNTLQGVDPYLVPRSSIWYGWYMPWETEPWFPTIPHVPNLY
jgi:hypothetical protein